MKPVGRLVSICVVIVSGLSSGRASPSDDPQRGWSVGAFVNMLENSPREEAALKRLGKPVPASYVGWSTFGEAIGRLERGMGVQLHVNWDALREARLTRTTRVLLEDQGVSYERYIDTFCAQLSITLVLYYKQPGIFWLTTRAGCPPEIWARAAANGDPDLLGGNDLDSPADRVMRQRLQATVRRFEVGKEGLEKVLDQLGQACRCTFFVNWTALQAAGIDKDTPLSIKLANVAAARVLTTILSDVGGGAANLGYTIDEGVVTISTRDDLNSAKYQMVRVYDIRPLFARGLATESQETQVANLIDLIEETVAPDSWRDKGGIIGSIRALNGRLIVNQTRDNQVAIGNLLQRMLLGAGAGARRLPDR